MINIQDIIPFMRKGWVAMDKDGEWYWFENEIERTNDIWIKKKAGKGKWRLLSDIFDIAPADDWTKSLIKVKGV